MLSVKQNDFHPTYRQWASMGSLSFVHDPGFTVAMCPELILNSAISLARKKETRFAVHLDDACTGEV
jgi:hypothetical protein